MEPPTSERKELVVQTPKLEGLVRVAKQAIESLKERKDTAERSKAKRPLMAKGLSAVVEKGKCSVSKSATASATTLVGAETLPLKTEGAAVAETPKTAQAEEQPHTAKRLPVCEERAMLQVDVDLAISTEASETETENYKDVTVATKGETYSDVEPSSPERMETQEQQQESAEKKKPVMVPEILDDFTESIVITDDEEPKLVMDMPIVSVAEGSLSVLAERPTSQASISMERKPKSTT